MVKMAEFQSVFDFFRAHQNDIFRFWVYRKVYTPYERQKAFMDESMFEDTGANYGFIVECASMGNDDFLVGFRTVADPDEIGVQSYNGPIEYYRLSEIRMGLYQPATEEE